MQLSIVHSIRSGALLVASASLALLAAGCPIAPACDDDCAAASLDGLWKLRLNRTLQGGNPPHVNTPDVTVVLRVQDGAILTVMYPFATPSAFEVPADGAVHTDVSLGLSDLGREITVSASLAHDGRRVSAMIDLRVRVNFPEEPFEAISDQRITLDAERVELGTLEGEFAYFGSSSVNGVGDVFEDSSGEFSAIAQP